MANPLLQIPGLGGFVAGQQRAEAQQANQLQNAATATGLVAALQQHEQAMKTRQEQDALRLKAQQQDEAFKKEYVALGPNPSIEKVLSVAGKYSNPEKLVDLHFEAQKHREVVADRALRHVENLSLRQQQMELQREQFLQRTTDAKARQAFEEKYKTDSLRLREEQNTTNTLLRQLGIEQQRERTEQGQRDREEKAIEGQIGKTADRMKDVQPVFTAAKQLNDTLNMYTPQDVPGVGYLKNTDMGKFFLSDQGKDVSSKIKLFGNSVLKAMSGAAVTAPEEIRQMAAQMADGRFSAQDFFIAWPTMSAWVNDQVSLSTAGLTPQARERFLERTGLKLDPISPRFTFDAQGGGLKDSRAPAAVPPPPPGFVINR